ncbi:MAG: DUF134 domain-containing protein [Lachnospiraceae bacterium]
MPRPQKTRHIGALPDCRAFAPEDNPGGEDDAVELYLDEWEAVRLTDLEGCDQAEAAFRLGVARSTYQNILQSARHKIADALVNGKACRIGGGAVTYSRCDVPCCERAVSVPRVGGLPDCEKKEIIMRIVVTYDPHTGEIFQHFGKTSYFKVYDVNDGILKKQHVESTNGQGHAALAGILKEMEAKVLICGGIGAGAQNALSAAGIQIFGGCSGSADDAVKDFLAGNLHYQEDVHCDHHEGHEEEGCHCHG